MGPMAPGALGFAAPGELLPKRLAGARHATQPPPSLPTSLAGGDGSSTSSCRHERRARAPAALGTGLALLAATKGRRKRRGGACVRAALPIPKSADGNEGISIFADGLEENATMDNVKQVDMTPKRVAIVQDVEGEIVFVKAGFGVELNAKPGAQISFEGGAGGYLLVWKESVAIVTLAFGEVSVGETAKQKGELLTAANYGTIGRIIDPKGRALDGGPQIEHDPATDLQRTFSPFKEMNDRTNDYRPLHTGVLAVDFSCPVGRGQTMLFQGTDIKKDKEHLWPDLLCTRPADERATGKPANIAICETLEAARELQAKLEARGAWDRCVIVVADSPGLGAYVVALNAAVAVAEMICNKDGEATVVFDLEAMHRVWNYVAKAAGLMRDEVHREEAGEYYEEEQENYVELNGTMVTESIAERRKFWFALISRAINDKNRGGSVSLLAWGWEKVGGLDKRMLQTYQTKLESVANIPRITEEMREKMVDKIKEQALAEGFDLDRVKDLDEPDEQLAGLPNWEIEELKSITDGHVLLKPPTSPDKWTWNMDPYRSLPRLGTDALHPALIAMGAHKLRLKMLQGRDRATMIGDFVGSEGTLGNEETQVDLRFVELILEQPAGSPMSVKEQVVRLAATANPNCKQLKAAPELRTLDELVGKILESEFAGRLIEQGTVTDEAMGVLEEEISRY